MAPSQREPPPPFAVWPWGLLPAALQPVWVQDTNHRSPLHPLLLVAPDDRMILMEWTDFWKTNSLKSHPWTGSPKLQFQFKNLGHLSLKFRNCYSTLSCRLILHKIWHCFQAMFTMQMLLLKRWSCCVLFAEHLSHLYFSITYLPFMQLIRKRGNTMTEAICSLLFSLRQPYLSEGFFALPPLTKAPVSG